MSFLGAVGSTDVGIGIADWCISIVFTAGADGGLMFAGAFDIAIVVDDWDVSILCVGTRETGTGVAE